MVSENSSKFSTVLGTRLGQPKSPTFPLAQHIYIYHIPKLRTIRLVVTESSHRQIWAERRRKKSKICLPTSFGRLKR